MLALDLAGLGRILMFQKRYAEAEPIFREAMDIRQQRLPPDDLRSLLTQASLGRCLVGMGRSSEAEPLLSDALARAYPQLRANEPAWISVADDLELVYESSGHGQRAEDVRKMKAAIQALK